MAKKPSWDNYLNSGYYNGSGVAALQGQLGSYTTDQAALRQQATAQYQGTYDAQTLALRQELESILGGYSNQLSGLDQAYEMQRRATNSQYDQSGSQAQVALTKRGLGRSSVVGTTAAAIEGARNQALNDLANKETDAISDIQNNIALAKKQSADSLNGLASGFASQVEARANELYNTNLAAQTNINVQIAALQQAGWNAYMSWYYSHGPGKKSSSSHRSSSHPGSANSSKAPTTNNMYNYANNTQGGTGANSWFATGAR
jgi:hypothetical protein